MVRQEWRLTVLSSFVGTPRSGLTESGGRALVMPVAQSPGFLTGGKNG
jgi:hypothetical protein